jgi:hypothetical protein
MSEEVLLRRAGRYDLVARVHKGTPTGVIRVGRDILKTVTGTDLDEVWGQLLDHLSELAQNDARQRGGVKPSTQEATTAFQRLGPNLPTSYKAMLREHLRRPQHGITATQLADAAGFKHWGAANLHYGMLGAMVNVEIPEVLPTRKNGKPIMTWALATMPPEKPEDEHCVWTMRPHIAAGLSAAGIL